MDGAESKKMSHLAELCSQAELSPAMDSKVGNVKKRPESLLARLEARMGFRTKIVWINVVSVALMHIMVPWAFYNYAFPVMWKTLALNYGLYVMGSFGVSGGVHRYWSHRSYSASWPLRLILMACFAMSGQKTIYGWVRDHRIHHKYVDTDADPHNIKRGFFFAHVGWNLMKKLPEVIKRGNEVDMSDITSDRIASFYDRHNILMQVIFSFIYPICTPLLWGENLACAATWRWGAYFMGIHSTWAINSFAHAVGSRPFNRNIKPTDNRLLSIFLADEGYHNYHHTFPWDYSTSELGYVISISITTPLIDAFSKLGWAYGMKQPSPQLVAAIASNRGDGSRSHFTHHHHEEVPEETDGTSAEKKTL